MPPKYSLVEEAANHCWSKNFLEVFREFFADHAEVFMNAPERMSGEQNLEYYSLFQRYLKLYEKHLEGYIKSLDVSVGEFYNQLAEIKDDPAIKDRKLLHFVNYLVASTDYPSFYKVMVRAAKKVRAKEYDADVGSLSETRSESKTSSSPQRDAKESYSDRKDYK